MDQEKLDSPRVSVDSIQIHESIRYLVFETVIMINSEQNGGISGENGYLGSKKVVIDDSDDSTAQVNQESSTDPVGDSGAVLGTQEAGGGAIEEDVELGLRGNRLATCSINRKSFGRGSCEEDDDGETVCRICHLGFERSVEVSDSCVSMDLIQIGCGCKDDLGIAHSHCAEAWFKIKGNRMCEICGQTAKNVTGSGGDNSFMQEWNELRLQEAPSNRSRGCWRGQPFCNFLMACLVMAFVIPWFFRINVF